MPHKENIFIQKFILINYLLTYPNLCFRLTVYEPTCEFKSSTRAKPALQKGGYSLVDLVSVSILAEKRATIR